MYSFSKFQGRRGNRAARSLTEWHCQTIGFGAVEIKTCVLHGHHPGVFIVKFRIILKFGQFTSDSNKSPKGSIYFRESLLYFF